MGECSSGCTFSPSIAGVERSNVVVVGRRSHAVPGTTMSPLSRIIDWDSNVVAKQQWS